ncbi:MAG TPA: AEC family transporter [Clostridia bacterium]|nr:AEC family transporter [Clostridia bacterium]
MNETYIIITKVIAFFLMMIPAILISKRKMVSERLAGDLSTMLLYITQPAMIVYSFFRDFDMAIVKEALMVLLLSTIVTGLFFLACHLLYRKQPSEKAKVLRYITVFSNSGYLCFPILYAIFGDIGILYGSVSNIIFTVFVWTGGVRIYRKDVKAFSLKNILLNPSSIAVYIASVIFAFSLYKYIPVFIADTVNTIGQMTAPLAMFVIGLKLSEVQWKGLFSDLPMFSAIGIRLIVSPLVALAIAYLLGITGYALAITFITCAMPAATATVIFAEKLDADSVYASKCVVVSTVFSIITIPVMLLLLGAVNV